ncbi:MAG: alpha/beta fold hydrolase, partial [Bacteroidota bacterium]
MKNTIIVLVIAISSMACKQNTKEENIQNDTTMNTIELTTTEQDTKAINALIDTLFGGVDNHDWDAVKRTMADSVYTDYSALGGQPGFATPDEILKGWKALLPGFERTIHQVHNQAIWVAGDRASATFDAIATHYLNNDQWTVFVGYDTEFIKENDDWKLVRIDLSFYDQNGNTNLSTEAMENVSKGTTFNFNESDTKAKRAVDQFFSALEAQDLDQLLNTLDDEVVQEMPLAPTNFPKSLNGIDAMKAQYTGVMGYTQTYERRYYSTVDPNAVLVKFNGTITTSEGEPYNNYYVGIYTTNEAGKIVKFTELFNPNIILSSWPGLQPETYSVHNAGAKTSDGVTMEEVTFNSNGLVLKGHLFLPPNFDDSKTYPASIVTGSWTSVKEQMPDEYASLLAQDGFITLTFDFTGFGESEGQPRQVEDYNLKINDIKAAVDYMVQHKNIDQTNLSGLGVCASSGYMAHATAQDERIKTLVLVAPWLHNQEIAKMVYDMRPGGTQGLLKAAKDAKVKYAETGEMDYVLAASELDPLSAMYVPQNAFDYYLNPAK